MIWTVARASRFDTFGGDDGAGLWTGAVTIGLLYEGDVDDAEGFGFEENDGVTVWE